MKVREPGGIVARRRVSDATILKRFLVLKGAVDVQTPRLGAAAANRLQRLVATIEGDLRSRV